MQHKLFVAEGLKTINELYNSHYELVQWYTISNQLSIPESLTTIITPKDLSRISFLKTPNTALALFKIPERYNNELDDLVVALDNVRDPGNLGTIIRLCDWFGVTQLLCNTETVDCYNPKVVQASMGSLARVTVSYSDLSTNLSDTPHVVCGTYMDGENLYSSDLSDKTILVFGNEANGISEELGHHIDKKLAIPRFGDTQETESLNVANAVAIFLSEFKRRSIEK